jgi:hypothetical protein
MGAGMHSLYDFRSASIVLFFHLTENSDIPKSTILQKVPLIIGHGQTDSLPARCFIKMVWSIKIKK